MGQCPLFKICKSPSKRTRGWACTKDNETRRLSCAVYIAFYRGVHMQGVLDLAGSEKDISRKPLVPIGDKNG